MHVFFNSFFFYIDENPLYLLTQELVHRSTSASSLGWCRTGDRYLSPSVPHSSPKDHGYSEMTGQDQGGSPYRQCVSKFLSPYCLWEEVSCGCAWIGLDSVLHDKPDTHCTFWQVRSSGLEASVLSYPLLRYSKNGLMVLFHLEAECCTFTAMLPASTESADPSLSTSWWMELLDKFQRIPKGPRVIPQTGLRNCKGGLSLHQLVQLWEMTKAPLSDFLLARHPGRWDEAALCSQKLAN